MLQDRSTRTRLSYVALVMTLAATLLWFTAPEASSAPVGEASDEAAFVSQLNGVRASKGLAPLAVHPTAETLATQWANQLAVNGGLSHTADLTVGIEHLSWLGTGENVGRATLSDKQVKILVDAFVASPAHYDNIVGTYTHIGVGVVYADGQIWTAHRFLNLSGAPATTTTTTTTTTAPPATAPPATAPPVTAPPATFPPVTFPPATAAPVNNPVQQPPATSPPAPPLPAVDNSDVPSTPINNSADDGPVDDITDPLSDDPTGEAPSDSPTNDSADADSPSYASSVAEAWGISGTGDMVDADREPQRVRLVLAALHEAAA